MRRKFVLLALRYPNLNLLLLRRTLPELRENHIVPLQRELYGAADFNGTERVFRFLDEAEEPADLPDAEPAGGPVLRRIYPDPV